jgi:bla regulator protein BlaR1
MQMLWHIALNNAVVAAVMALLLLPAARWAKRPALTHALSLLILLKLVTPPLVNLPLIWPALLAAEAAPRTVSPTPSRPAAGDQAMDPSQTIVDLAPAALADAPPPAPPGSAPRGSLANIVLGVLTGPWLAAAWAVSSAFYAAVILIRLLKLRRAVRRATVPGQDLSQDVARLARQIGLTRAPEVRFVSGVAPPMLLALFGKPCVLVPVALWSRLDDPKRQTLLLHELAHLRRRDHWVRYLELAATCAYWWHPAAWWARSALREAEEQCCDAWVIWAMPAARRTYMTTLLDAVDFISESVRPNSLAAPVLASGMGQFQHLQRRLTMVRERSVQRRLSGGGLVAVVLSAIALPLGPRLLRADDAPPASGRQPPAVEERPGTEGDGANADPRANQRQTTPAADATDTTGSTRSPQANSPQTDARRAGPGQAPAGRNERSGMSQVESLDAQLKAARMQIEALEQELAASKAGSGPRTSVIAAGPDVNAVRVEPPARVLIVDPSAPAPPNPPGPGSKIIIQYNNGKLEAITVPGQKTIWTNEIGPLGTIESVDGKIVVHDANGKVFEIAVNDGRILSARAGAVGVVTPPAAPGLRGATTPAQTEERLEAIEGKLNALIEAMDRRAKSDAAREGQPDRAREGAGDARWRDEKGAPDPRSRRDWAPAATTPPDATPRQRESAPAAPTPPDATPRQRESAPAATTPPDATPPRRETTSAAPSDPDPTAPRRESTPAPPSDPDPTAPRREPTPADGGRSQRESAPATR